MLSNNLRLINDFATELSNISSCSMMLNVWPWTFIVEQAPLLIMSCRGSNCIISANGLDESIDIKFFSQVLYLQNVEDNISKSWSLGPQIRRYHPVASTNQGI